MNIFYGCVLEPLVPSHALIKSESPVIAPTTAGAPNKADIPNVTPIKTPQETLPVKKPKPTPMIITEMYWPYQMIMEPLKENTMH